MRDQMNPYEFQQKIGGTDSQRVSGSFSKDNTFSSPHHGSDSISIQNLNLTKLKNEDQKDHGQPLTMTMPL